MASVTHRETDAGDHQIGVKIGKTFVPFLTLAAANVAQLVENEQNKSGDEPESDDGEEA